MNENIDILQGKSVLDMLTVANEFCFFTENIKSKDLNTCLNFYQKVLPLLYLKGSLLPEIEVDDNSANERFVTEEHWENVFNAIKEVFKEKDIFPTLNDNNVIVETSFADHISDIYQDLKDFVMLFQRNRISSQENSVFECKKLFENHWGQRITRLIDRIHNMIYSTNDEYYF